jgi:hypothetical protein
MPALPLLVFKATTQDADAKAADARIAAADEKGGAPRDGSVWFAAAYGHAASHHNGMTA